MVDHVNYCHVTESNYYVSRFVLSQPPKLPRLITMRVLVFHSMIWTLCLFTHFSAFLKIFVIKPGIGPNAKNWNDFHRLDYKILFSTDSYQYVLRLCGVFCRNTEHSWMLENTLGRFSPIFIYMVFITNYAYAVDLFLWHVVKLKMRLLKQPIFLLTDICLQTHLLPKNSIYFPNIELNLFFN